MVCLPPENFTDMLLYWTFSCVTFVINVQLMSIVIKVADVSNECRPMNVAEPWLECLLEEFFAQVCSSSTRVTYEVVRA